MTEAGNLAKLPEMCASRLLTDGSPILIKAGVIGYWPAHRDDLDVDAFNADMGVTPAQKMAMEIGSMVGFGVPGADPDKCAEILARKGKA